MKRPPGLALLAAVLALLVATGVWVATRPPEPARWLRVEVPPVAVAGEDFPLRVVLYVTRLGEFLQVELHAAGQRGDDLGVLARPPLQPTRAQEGAYLFRAPVVPRAGMTGIYAIVSVSPTGRWSERVRVCRTDLIPLGPGPGGTAGAERIRVPLFEELPAPRVMRADSARIHGVIAGLLLVAAAACAWSARQEAGVASPMRTRWAWLAMACLLAAIWEWSGAEAALGDGLRRFALAHGVYSKRRLFQQVATGLILIVAAGLAWSRLRRDHAQPSAVTFSAVDVFWGVAAVSFISLHDVDAWLARPLLAMPAGLALKLGAGFAAAAAALVGAFSRRSR